MEFIKNLGEKAKDIGGMAKDLTKRSGELLEVTKLRFEINKLQKILDNNLEAIGELSYRRFKGEEGLGEEIERLLQSTQVLEKDMENMKEQIEKLTPKAPACPKCSKELPQEANYCANCGQKVVE
ncbi:zinc ribbon domain-containing protein [Desulforamulus ruminis]|uniref:Zinc-ribbon domain-containing protein n=1 Tax=Desulforamulus ruminis (strain ATCC 23193 / DSM 2154 / NCIMB 8452 / DL) TaxID=696281 RepID=F6DTZ8_DESRL|nr:zinc ribbon domain-containing protein [Desulforamulus ruminis]AEG59016.1 hypothetical protein Desru_0733 [Desulforamulus ruminis DSM 2154]